MQVVILTTNKVEHNQMMHCKSESWSQLTCFICFSLKAINLDELLGSLQNQDCIPLTSMAFKNDDIN